MSVRTSAIIVFNLLLSISIQSQINLLMKEESCIYYSNNELFIVCDSEDILFKYPFAANQEPDYYPLADESKLTRTCLSHERPTMDIEGISMYKGKIIYLSEDLNSIFYESGDLIKTYSDPFKEMGGRGLEGVATSEVSDCEWQVACIWEGGYLELTKVPSGLDSRSKNSPFQPIILNQRIVHDDFSQKIDIISLDLRKVNNYLDAIYGMDGKEPYANRCRAADLILYDNTFIVLLSSERRLTATEEKETDKKKKNSWKFKSKLLVRFDKKGNQVGDILDFAKHPVFKRDQKLLHKNLEGLCWYDKKKKKILLNHESGDENPGVAVLNIEKWLSSASK